MEGKSSKSLIYVSLQGSFCNLQFITFYVYLEHFSAKIQTHQSNCYIKSACETNNLLGFHLIKFNQGINNTTVLFHHPFSILGLVNIVQLQVIYNGSVTFLNFELTGMSGC